MSFLTTSRPTTWSKTAWSPASSIRQNLTRSRCQVSSAPGSRAVTDTCHVTVSHFVTGVFYHTWKNSSVVTPNHSGESKN